MTSLRQDQVRAEPADPDATKTSKVVKRRRYRERLGSVLYVAPLVCAVCLVVVGPAVLGLSHSFFAWQPGGSSPWVGLGNYTSLARSPFFREILVNEGIYLLGLPIWTLLPIVIAVFLFGRVRGAALVRSLIFLPAIVSPALLGVMFTPILAPDGLVNETLDKAHLHFLAHAWIQSPSLVKPTIIVLLAWANVGLGVAIFTAALTSISPSLLDAANVVGASASQRLRYVILPSLRKTLALWVTYEALGVFLWLFGYIYALTNGGPGNSSTSLDFDIFTNTITNGLYGLGAAESIYLLAIVCVLVVVGWSLGRLWSYD